MPSRHRSRERALQVLFQLDMRKQTVDEALSALRGSLYSSEEEGDEPALPDEFTEQLVRTAAASLEETDRQIAEHSEHWRIERMSAVDRNILRLAASEMMTTSTPPAVVIDEALRLARRFSGEESVAFINGVLDAIHKELAAQDKFTASPPPNP